MKRLLIALKVLSLAIAFTGSAEARPLQKAGRALKATGAAVKETGKAVAHRLRHPLGGRLCGR